LIMLASHAVADITDCPDPPALSAAAPITDITAGHRTQASIGQITGRAVDLIMLARPSHAQTCDRGLRTSPNSGFTPAPHRRRRFLYLALRLRGVESGWFRQPGCAAARVGEGVGAAGHLMQASMGHLRNAISHRFIMLARPPRAWRARIAPGGPDPGLPGRPSRSNAKTHRLAIFSWGWNPP
jgi:hypothetical protein